jgi:hypothetical protein
MGDKTDVEMIKLIKYLQHIYPKEDLRTYNDKVFQLNKIYKSRIDCFIKYYDFDVISDDSDQSLDD